MRPTGPEPISSRDLTTPTPWLEWPHSRVKIRSQILATAMSASLIGRLGVRAFFDSQSVLRISMFDRHGTGVPVVRRKMPDVATLLLLMEDGKLAKLRCVVGS